MSAQEYEMEQRSRLRFQRIGPDQKPVYLHHMDLSRRTHDPNWAWSGSLRQAMNVRKLYPHTKELPLVRVQHRQNPR